MSTTISIAQLGAGYIGKVHSLAYRALLSSARPLDAHVELRTLVDDDAAVAADVATRYGWTQTATDWADAANDPAVSLFDNAGPNFIHEDPCIVAAKNGKHVLCEKPLAMSSDAAHRMWRAVSDAGVLHQCAFIYRAIPAIALARQLIEAGEIGEVRHFRANYLLSSPGTSDFPMSWRFDSASSGTGALGDLGSHHVDLARFLVGEPTEVTALTEIFVPERSDQRVTTDDAFAALARFSSGATASFEGSRVAGSQGLASRVEVDGSRGSLAFDLQRVNELAVSERGRSGFRTVNLTQIPHPYSDFWFPESVQAQPPIGWAECFAHQAHWMLSAISQGCALPTQAATFADGYRVAEVIDTMARAASEKRWLPVQYRDLSGGA
ncbi:Gfo/Idh/MocA family protein [Streptomyces sp. NBC_00443]|uniref:Gfo/Idh/MocA family protein n=1 Tax=Streptomyces sp. NBC_00443 TaxID=2975743 RepID=UPI002E212451